MTERREKSAGLFSPPLISVRRAHSNPGPHYHKTTSFIKAYPVYRFITAPCRSSTYMSAIRVLCGGMYRSGSTVAGLISAFSCFSLISMATRLHYSVYFFTFCYFVTTFLKFNRNHMSSIASFPFFEAAHASRMMMHMYLFPVYCLLVAEDAVRPLVHGHPGGCLFTYNFLMSPSCRCKCRA